MRRDAEHTRRPPSGRERVARGGGHGRRGAPRPAGRRAVGAVPVGRRGAAGGRGRPGARVRPGGAAQGAAGLLRHRPALPADGHQRPDGQRRGRPARAVGHDQHRQGGADRAPTSPAGSSTTTSTSPATRSGPGCTYEEWEARLAAASRPTTYARMVTQAGVPGPAGAPVLVLLRVQRLEQHPRGRLGDDPAQLRRGHPGPGAHAAARRGRLQPALQRRARPVGRRQAPGRGRDPPRRLPGGRVPGQLLPVEALPHAQHGRGARVRRHHGAVARRSGPSWTRCRRRRPTTSRPSPGSGFDGRWGEKQAAFFNGPVGPNRSLRWTEPFTWEREELAGRRASAVPAGTTVGTQATDFFCGAVAGGSALLRAIKINPGRAALVLAALVLLLLWPLSRTRWQPSSVLTLARRPPLGAADHDVRAELRPPPAGLPRHRAALHTHRPARRPCCSGCCSG